MSCSYGKLAPSKVGNSRAQEEADGPLNAAAAKTDKKDANDFVLWKKSKPGEPVWDSQWGQGRPGWHIEVQLLSLCFFFVQTLFFCVCSSALPWPAICSAKVSTFTVEGRICIFLITRTKSLSARLFFMIRDASSGSITFFIPAICTLMA